MKPLWAAYKAVATARDKRGPLDLDLPERKIVLDDKGKVARVVTPQRLEAHRLIEEFMIQANVAAAETLEEKRLPLVYRVHDAPSPEKLKGLRDFLETLDMKVPHAGALKPEAFNQSSRAGQRFAGARSHQRGHPALAVTGRIYAEEHRSLRAQSRTLCALHIAHPPLRRSHRASRAHSGAWSWSGWLTDEENSRLASVAKSISDTERRAMAAERETTDRLIAAHLADHVGATFHARIAGVTRSGLFVRLKDTGADGYIPISSLGDDYYHHVEAAHALVGARSGRRISPRRCRRSAPDRGDSRRLEPCVLKC